MGEVGEVDATIGVGLTFDPVSEDDGAQLAFLNEDARCVCAVDNCAANDS